MGQRWSRRICYYKDDDVVDHVPTYTNRSLESDYVLDDDIIGNGKTGHVRIGTCISTRTQYAIKIVSMSYLLASSNRKSCLDNEISILSKLHSHPNIVSLHAVYKEEHRISIVMTLLSSQSVLSRIIKCSDDDHEREIANVIRSVATALEYVHSCDIIHRDIKPENILYSRDGRDIYVIDFGIANSRNMAGTSHFMAPEVFSNTDVTSAVDIWALGITTYYMVFGTFPFDAKFLSLMEDKIKTGVFEFPSDRLSDCSVLVVDFIKQLLVVDPSRRPSASRVLEHPWLNKENERQRCSSRFTKEHLESLRNSIEERDKEINDGSVLF